MIASGDILGPANLNQRIAINKITADSTGFTTTEVNLGSVTATLVNGQTYGVWAEMRFSVSAITYTYAAANLEVVVARIREDAGIAGTEMDVAQMPIFNVSPSGHGPIWLYGEYTAVATGSKTFSITGIRGNGAGTYIMRASATRSAKIFVNLIT